jgi:hypothetical protein
MSDQLNKSTAISEPVFTVLDPRGQPASIENIPLAPRLKDLNGKTVCIIDSFAPSEKNASGFEKMFHQIIPAGLKLRFPQVKVIFKERSSLHRAEEAPLFTQMQDEGVDAYIMGTTIATTLVSSAFAFVASFFEKKGLPGMVLLFDALESVAKFSQENYGCPVRFTAIHCPETAMTQNQIDTAIESTIKNLTAPLTPEESNNEKITQVKYPRILLTATLDQIQNYFYQQGLTDGFPIIPPTENRVQAMINHTSHKPDEILTRMFPPWNLEEVTVEKVAINSVMAGCDPQYFPVLLAMVEAYLKAGGGDLSTSTNSFTFMSVINGPIRHELQMNAGYGALGGMNKANNTLGRALKLYIINLGGGKMGINMLPVIGNVANSCFCFPENEEQSPWASFSLDQGYKPEDSTLSFFFGGWAHSGNYGFADLAEVSKDIAQYEFPSGATILVSPGRINYLKKADGSLTMTKDDFKKYIQEHAVLPLGEFKSNHFFNLAISSRKANGEIKPEDLNQPDNTPFPIYGKNNIWVLVVGGGAAPMMQAWQIGKPVTVSIDKWR